MKKWMIAVQLFVAFIGISMVSPNRLNADAVILPLAVVPGEYQADTKDGSWYLHLELTVNKSTSGVYSGQVRTEYRRRADGAALYTCIGDLTYVTTVMGRILKFSSVDNAAQTSGCVSAGVVTVSNTGSDTIRYRWYNADYDASFSSSLDRIL